MEDSNLVRHAMAELEAAGLTKPDSDYNRSLASAVLALIRLFASQGHSGMSAGMVTELFSKLARYEPLCPLTGDESEWRDCREPVVTETSPNITRHRSVVIETGTVVTETRSLVSETWARQVATLA